VQGKSFDYIDQVRFVGKQIRPGSVPIDRGRGEVLDECIDLRGYQLGFFVDERDVIAREIHPGCPH